MKPFFSFNTINKSLKIIKHLYINPILNTYKPRIFCISVQRTGTTSTGQFFKYFKYPVATWPVSARNSWGYHWYNGNFEAIFSSRDFRANRVYEDNPWWFPEFYKVLYHRFPKAKFILFIRDSSQWFESMKNLSEGKTPGNTREHCKTYYREKEFYYQLDHNPAFKPHEKDTDNLLNLNGMDEHYKSCYELRNREIIDYFSKFSPQSLFVCKLEDPLKWQKLGKYIGIDVPDNFEIHANKSI